MEKTVVLYYSPESDSPVEVDVLVFRSAIHLYEPGCKHLLQSFPLKQTQFLHEGEVHRFYFDNNNRHYMELSPDHPLMSTLGRDVSEARQGAPARLVRSRAVLVLGFLVVFIIGVYFLLLTSIPYLGLKLISREQEIEIGENLHGGMLRQARLMGEEVDEVKSKQLQAFADALGISEKYPVRVTLVKSNTINAYAVPGGHIVVYSALLDKIRTPEALAALLAHEGTHVNERHSLRSILRSAANGIMIAVVFGDAGGVVASLASNANALNGLRYSRSLEEEADNKAMNLLLEKSIPVQGMRQLLQALQQEGHLNGSFSFLSSHPLTKDRIENADAFIRHHPQEKAGREDLSIMFGRLYQP